MNHEITTKHLDGQHYVGIRTVTTPDKIASAMGSLFGELYGHVVGSGQSPAGMPFSIYYSMPGETVEFECAMPVASPMAGTDRIRPGELPSGTVATVTHLGPYENLPRTWMAITQWVQDQGLEHAGAPWEVYVTDPGAEPDSSKWRTDIFIPVR